jgi:3-hydroxyisobutyrate dehydrogenase-like beta-hydroxyacid dehydrogenase
MKIGIIGSGIVGRVLGSAFLKEGYEVTLGTRNTSKEEVVKWKQENPKGMAGNFKDAAAFGDMIVLSVSGNAKVTVILSAFGFETEDMGAAEAARAIEPLCMLWCIPGLTSNQWSHAFKLLKK